MTIQQSIDINKPIDNCWKVLGQEFPNISKWASSIHKSTGHGTFFSGSNCSERECLNGKTIFLEKLVKFENDNHLLSYDITQGTPGFVQHANNTWQLLNKDNKTTLQMTLQITTKGLLGSVLGQVMKVALTKQFNQMMEEFKYYVETGQPHKRKIKSKNI